jgi:hypothetical protein
VDILSPEVPSSWRRLNPRAFVKELSARWMLGFFAIALSFFAGILYLHVATHKYTAELLVVPADQPDSSLPSSMAGLGSLVGLDISQNNLSFTMYTDALATGQVAEAIGKNARIMRNIFANEWDEKAQAWREPAGPVRTLSQWGKELLGIPIKSWSPPGPQQVREYISKRVKVSEEKRRPVIRITYENKDPHFAKYFLENVSSQADLFLREQSIARTSAYISYLEKRLMDVTIAEQRQSLAQLISSYEKSRMMSSSSASFAGDRFGEINISPRPTSPNLVLVLAISFSMGLLIWTAITVVLVMRSLD